MLAGARLWNCPKDFPMQLLPNDRDDDVPNLAKTFTLLSWEEIALFLLPDGV